MLYIIFVKYTIVVEDVLVVVCTTTMLYIIILFVKYTIFVLDVLVVVRIVVLVHILRITNFLVREYIQFVVYFIVFVPYLLCPS